MRRFGILLCILMYTECQIREHILGEFPNAEYSYRNVNDVSYFLYNREYLNKPVNLNDGVAKLNKNLETKVIIHGFTESSRADWYKDMAHAYLNNRKLNIIAVDWSPRAAPPYLRAVKESQSVGNAIGYYLTKLNGKGRIDIWNTHVIGHSLGSHVAGFVGQFIYGETGRKIKRISALDPAGPLFQFPFIGVNDRLSKDDAVFVDAVHTDSGLLGYRSSIGDADYFANGGFAMQPGCKIPTIDNVLEYVCSHQRSHQYFIESINSNKFVSKSCDSWTSYLMGFCESNDNVVFGENGLINATGNFYFRTNSAPPYAISNQ